MVMVAAIQSISILAHLVEWASYWDGMESSPLWSVLRHIDTLSNEGRWQIWGLAVPFPSQAFGELSELRRSYDQLSYFSR